MQAVLSYECLFDGGGPEGRTLAAALRPCRGTAARHSSALSLHHLSQSCLALPDFGG